ncbi:hypothetical protein KY331_02235, partial [Candidatus Woesearchaeota archaeon]|nr:hypothetical protein [Candidatus Woesearchaeota archaeon]
MAKAEGSGPLGGKGFGGSAGEKPSDTYSEKSEKDMLSTRVQNDMLAGFEESNNLNKQRSLCILGQHLVEGEIGAPPDFFYSQKRLSLLRQSVRRSIRPAFTKYAKVDQKWYASRTLQESNEDAIKKELQGIVCDLEEKSQKLQDAGDKPGKAGFTKEEYEKIKRYREYVNELRIADEQFSTELDQLEEAWNQPTAQIITDMDELRSLYKDYVCRILQKAEGMQGNMGEQIEAARLKDENKRLVGIVHREIGGIQESDIQTFVGESFLNHVYEIEHLDLLEQLGKGLDLTHEGQSIDKLFEQDPLKAQEIIQDQLDKLEIKHSKLQEADKASRDTALKEKDMHVYGLYVGRKKDLDKMHAEGKLLKKASPRHLVTFMAKFRKAHGEFLYNLLKSLGETSYSPDVSDRIGGIVQRADQYVKLLPEHRKLKDESEAKDAQIKQKD